jgi:hypothetical protein
MKSRSFLITTVCGFALFFFAGDLSASPVDLSTFEANPIDEVLFFDGGFSATIYEDSRAGGANPVSLGHWNFEIPAQAISFSFDYDLHVAGGNTDFFDFYIGNASEPVFEAGGSGAFTASGSFDFDLVAANFAGSSVPIIFDLMSDWEDAEFSSYVTISNVEVKMIPIPATLLLLGSGLLGIWGLSNRKQNHK